MAITADQRKEILGIADGLRAILRRMNAIDGDAVEISSRGYGHVSHGLSDCLAVLTEGKADWRLMECWVLDNPDETTEWCIQQWENERTPIEYRLYQEQAQLRAGTLKSYAPFTTWYEYQEARMDWSE